MRVIAGTVKGRRLRSAAGAHTRPTGAKVREALFDLVGGRVVGSHLADFFSGYGAVGIEALSRGARRAVFVERDRHCLRILRENLAACGLTERARIYPLEATAFVRQASRQALAFDLIFADPPYQGDALFRFLRSPELAAVLGPGGQLVIEHFHKVRPPEQPGPLVLTRSARYGDTVLAFYERAADKKEDRGLSRDV